MTVRSKHARERRRYFAVELRSWPTLELDRETFQEILWTACKELIGDRGSAATDLKVVRFDYENGSGEAVVRVRHHARRRGRAVLATVGNIEDTPVALHIVGVSGTIRGCEEKYLGRKPESYAETTVVYHGVDRSAVVAGEAVDIRTDGQYVGVTKFDLE